MDNVPRRGRGIAYAIASNLCFSTGGWFVRALESPPDGAELVFWRSLAMTATLGAIVTLHYGRRAAAAVAAVGAWGIVSAAFLTATFFGYLVGTAYTTVANVNVTMATAPFVTALAGLVFLGERVPLRTWIAIAVAAAGLGVTLAGALTAEGLAGIAIALIVPLGLAGSVVINRRHGANIDMVPTAIIAGLIGIVVALPFALPLTAGTGDIMRLSAMGAIQVGMGSLFMVLATRHLPAVEIGLFTLLETVMGPCWAWLAAGERPSTQAIAGGALIITAVLVNAGIARAAPRARAVG